MRIGFIGTGNMAGAILSGVVGAGFDSAEITITNRTIAKAQKFSNLGVNIVASSQAVIDCSDIIILGMKPDGYQQWLEQYDISNKKIISIGAGITSQFMEKYTNNFIITMPNTPSKLGFGSTLIVKSEAVTADVIAIFEAVGSTYLIEEQELDTYTLVTGCSPAYFFGYIANMSQVLSAEYNLDQQTVNKMLSEVMAGSAAMLKDEPNPQQLCDNVCSPGGITIEVVNQLNADLPQMFKNGFSKAIKRTNQLKERS